MRTLKIRLKNHASFWIEVPLGQSLEIIDTRMPIRSATIQAQDLTKEDILIFEKSQYNVLDIQKGEE